MMNTLLMVSITPKQIRDSLEDKSVSLTHFYLMQGKKKDRLGLYLQQADNILALIPQLFCQQINKKYPLV